MARTGQLVMHGDRDGEYEMFIDLAGIDFPPHKLRKHGYFAHSAILAGCSAAFDAQPTSGILPVEVEGNALPGNTHIETSPVLESQSSTASLKEVGDEEIGSQQVPNEEMRECQDPNTQATMGGFEEDVPRMSRLDLDPQAKMVGSKDDVPAMPSRLLQWMHKQKKPVRVVGRVPSGLALDDSSEEDEDPISEIDEYDILDEDNELVSLFELPLHHHENNKIVNVGCWTREKLHVRGKHGTYEIMRQITAWKLVSILDHPFHLQVKIDELHWVKLRKPAASYKKISEGVYFVVKFLDVVKKYPSATAKAVWKLLLERDIDEKTVRNYLKKQSQLIERYIALDPILTSANVLEAFQALWSRKSLNSQKRMRSDEEEDNDIFDRNRAKKKKPRMTTDHGKSSKVKETLGMEETGFQHAEDDVTMSETEEEVDEEEVDQDDEELGDPLCTICDDGGDLLCCEGPCMRSYHAHLEAGIDSNCKSLGFVKADLEKMEKYLCKNCKYKKHQCYVCGKLGTSDETLGAEREVFVCEVALCGKFYHPHCIAKEIAPSQGDERPLAKRIQSGEETFTCPMHTCKKCGKCEDKEDETEELRLAKCRRCPATWHVKCLPESIAFDDKCKPQRGWRVGKRPRFIIYCMKHDLDRKLQTPTRDHLLEPSTPERQPGPRMSNILNSQSKKTAQVRGVPGTSRTPRAKSRVANEYESAQSGFFEKEKTQEANAAREKINMHRRIMDVIRMAAERKPEDKIKSALLCKVPKAYKDKTFKEKDFISEGKLSSMLKAAGNALAKFLKSSRLEDACMICPSSDVSGILNTERMFKTFLAPTLFGNRYTSFGRHFTKVEKLQEVVDRLHIHIEDGDTLVDFCCGSNDFSIKMHEILTQNGKRNCRYKNFDIMKPKNAFHFEQKDWLTVTKDDLGPSENLVIGLNPPFADAKKFVLHALHSDPKLLVLIIPEDPGLIKSIEFKYTCILDDNQLLAGKAFYLPGSVHRAETEMLEQGNHIAPHLYLFRKILKQNKGMPSSCADYRAEEIEVPTRHKRQHLNASDSARHHQRVGNVGLDSLFIPSRQNPKMNKYQNPRTFAVPATNWRAPNNINNAPQRGGPPGFGSRPLSQNHHPNVAPRSFVPPNPRQSPSQNVAATSGRDPPRTFQSQHGVVPNAQFASSSRHHPPTPISSWGSAVRAHTINPSHHTRPPYGDMYGNNNGPVHHRLPLPHGNPLSNPPLPPEHPFGSASPHLPSGFPTALPSYLPPPPPIAPGMQISRFPNRDPRLCANLPEEFHQAPRQRSPSPPRSHDKYLEGGGWLED